MCLDILTLRWQVKVFRRLLVTRHSSSWKFIYLSGFRCIQWQERNKGKWLIHLCCINKSSYPIAQTNIQSFKKNYYNFVSGSNESMYILEGFGGVYFGGCFRLIVSDKSNLSLTAYSFKALKGKWSKHISLSLNLITKNKTNN